MATPTGGLRFELVPRTYPRVRADGDVVILRLDLQSLSEPLYIQGVEMVLVAEYAMTLGTELVGAARKLL
jgi:hypothetical protein